MKKHVSSAIISLFAGLLTWFLILDPLDRLNIDLFNWLLPSESIRDDIVIIRVDENSFSEIGQWPWPREVHGFLVDRLTAFGARKIIFDIQFSEPSSKESDEIFAKSIAQNSNVILASNLAERKDSFISGTVEILPIPELLDAGAGTGLAGVDPDADQVIRYIPSFSNTLSSVAAEIILEPFNKKDKIIRYRGESHTFPYTSYVQFLIEDGVIASDFNNKYVLIGLDVKATADISRGQIDQFPTPHSRFTGNLMPGVEVHANLLENLLQNSYVFNPSDSIKFSQIVLLSFLAWLVCCRFSPLRSMGFGVAVNLLLGGFSVYAWQAGVFINTLIGIPILFLVYVYSVGQAYLLEGRQKRMLKNAFGQYLSPDMVSALIANPERLSLGGEVQEMTIMFCDVRGFTPISEKFREKPEVLTEIINALLTNLSDDILFYGGTIDKYMGDCIMAFWNAPVPIDNHASRAIDAASRMMWTIDKVNQDLQNRKIIDFDLKIGIGVGTGTCVVGNMGSNQRFDYTVLGDIVNLVARIEGQTKHYGVTTILADKTASLATTEQNRAIAEIDLIRVKGQATPQYIYALEREEIDPKERKLVEEFLSFYRLGDWVGSNQSIKQLEEFDGKLASYSSVMKTRLDLMTNQPIPDGWSGIYDATSK